MTRALSLLVAAFSLYSTATSGQATGRMVTVLAADDSNLAAISVAAAKSIDAVGATPTGFAGVFIRSRQVREATDRVIAATRLVRSGDGSGKVPYMVARLPEGCPECDAALTADTWSFTMLRMTPDSAYVGAEISSIKRGKRSTCIALARVGNAWLAAATTPVKNAKSCGE